MGKLCASSGCLTMACRGSSLTGWRWLSHLLSLFTSPCGLISRSTTAGWKDPNTSRLNSVWFNSKTRKFRRLWCPMLGLQPGSPIVRLYSRLCAVAVREKTGSLQWIRFSSWGERISLAPPSPDQGGCQSWISRQKISRVWSLEPKLMNPSWLVLWARWRCWRWRTSPWKLPSTVFILRELIEESRRSLMHLKLCMGLTVWIGLSGPGQRTGSWCHSWRARRISRDCSSSEDFQIYLNKSW